LASIEWVPVLEVKGIDSAHGFEGILKRCGVRAFVRYSDEKGRWLVYVAKGKEKPARYIIALVKIAKGLSFYDSEEEGQIRRELASIPSIRSLVFGGGNA